MKLLLSLSAFCLFSITSFCQLSDWQVDSKAIRVQANDLDTLATRLTNFCSTDRQKVRSIFRWITENISYESFKRTPSKNIKPAAFIYPVAEPDSAAISKSLTDLVAENLLKKKTGVCESYCHLFKALCERAGIRCEIIFGYGRSDVNSINKNFHTNHAWNAVWLDGKWQLLDVTWASGYFIYGSNDFIRHFDERFFLTEPKDFAKDHFPEIQEWLLDEAIAPPDEFKKQPFKVANFIKYNISDFFPANGIIKTAPGDTLQFSITVNHFLKETKVFGNSVFDSLPLPASKTIAMIRPFTNDATNIVYQFIVPSEKIKWLQLVYNNDVILVYELQYRD